MKSIVIFLIIAVYANVALANYSKEEDLLLTSFSDAVKSKNLNRKCQAAEKLLNFYNKNGNKGKAEMAKGILKRDCNKSK